MKIALIMLTWNEIEGVKHDVPLIDKSQFDEIFCIDGGSTDGTVEYLTSQGIPVYQQTAKGLNQACKDGCDHCTADAFVFFHPKGSVPVEDTYKFRKFYEEGYEFVVASRMMKGAHNEEDGKLIKARKWFVLSLGLIAKILYKREGNTVWDTLHGFRGMTVDAFKRCEISDMSPSVDIEMVCRSYMLHLKRIEFPTTEHERIQGTSHFKAWPTGKKLLKYLWWEVRGGRKKA